MWQEGKIVSHYWPSSIIRAEAFIKGDQNKDGNI
jgi:hypothetical protein